MKCIFMTTHLWLAVGPIKGIIYRYIYMNVRFVNIALSVILKFGFP